MGLWADPIFFCQKLQNEWRFVNVHTLTYYSAVNTYQSKQVGRKMNAFQNFCGDKMLDLISVLSGLKHKTVGAQEDSKCSFGTFETYLTPMFRNIF